jgi:hypothetical protein
MSSESNPRIGLINRDLAANLGTSSHGEGEKFKNKDLSAWVFGTCIVGGFFVYEGCNFIHQYSHAIRPIINSVSNYLGFR